MSEQEKQQEVKDNALTHEQIISESQRGVDRSLTILNYTITAIGVLVGLFTLIVLVLGGILAYLGFGTYDNLKKELAKVEKVAEEAEETFSKVKPIVDNIAKIEEDMNGIKEEFKSELRNLSLSEKPSEETKEKLDELAKKSEFLEGVGVELDPEDYFNRGLANYYKGEYEKAKDAFGKVTELKPDYPDAWVNRGVALRKLGKSEEAIISYDKAIKLKPDDVRAWDNKGAALSRLGKHDEAIKHHEKAIELKPDYANAWYNMACVYSLKGDKGNALENLRKAVALDSKYNEMSKKDVDFKGLWDDEDFKKIVE